jgi:hypothetical protein
VSYPATQYWKVFETDEVLVAGGATFASDAQLAQVVVTLYAQGTFAGSERMRALLYHDQALTKLYATGAWTSIADAVGAAAAWRGDIPLNFAEGSRPFVEAGATYYVAIEVDQYTRDGETLFVSLTYDWPLPINENAATPPSYPLAMAFYVVQKVAY